MLLPVPGGRRRRVLSYVLLLVLIPIVLIYRHSSYLSELSVYLSENLYRYHGQANDTAVVLHDDDTEQQVAKVEQEEEIPDRLCDPDTECMDGAWRLRDPPLRTFADFKRIYPPSHRGVFQLCGDGGDKRELEDRERYRRAQEERMVQITNWVWKPKKGRMREWDAVEFVVRLLKSPGGLIFSGDSISRQHFQWFEYALARADVHIKEDPEHLPSYSHKRLHQFILKPGDSMTAYLQDRAGVPDSRLQRPIYTKIDNHILVGEKEIREYTVPLGAKQDFPWFDHFQYFEGWEEFVRETARARGEQGVAEDTILVLNTGAHWSRGAFYMLPNTGDAFEQQSRVTAALKRVINLITSRLHEIPRLSIYYRSTAPGHPACTSAKYYYSFGRNSSIIAQPDDDESSKRFTNVESFYTYPYPDIASAQEAMNNITISVLVSTPDKHQKVVQSRWDWDRLEANNEEWKQAIASLRQSPEAGTSSDKAKWYYMDVWNMSLQRPDAHTQTVDVNHGTYDCLHWCVPGVVEQWTEYLNHLVFFNRDELPS
ncbi:hypothetical protein D9756_010106 [Leucocoprinus leucothites]|uniref:Trichome birefringence-like C-terminal domain-containing protein n=1 Tax=Leucocoprinus leucothites TaxID=201217 RepID=A0A8H5CRE1_9AGAR|nr:hypothetical protein D9756_010106 [Leucoagaricus leucothites]